MSYVKLSVAKPGNNKGAGGDKSSQIILIDKEDLYGTFPVRDSKGVVITGNIALKANAYAISLYATSSSIKVGSTSEGDPDAEGFVQSLEFDHPGNSQEIREFRQNWLSKEIIAIVTHCSDSKKDLVGTPCAPLKMVIKWEDDKDKNKTTFTFKSSLKSGDDVADYQGTLTMDTVVATVAADATSVNLVAGEGRYQLTDGSAAAVNITGCTNPVNGMVFTLLGSGGTYPSTIDTGDSFELASGATWTALANATITFKVFKNAASAYIYIEQSRT